MIDDKTKDKLLEELEKGGNVYFSCLKAGISRATFYRWMKDDDLLAKEVRRVIHIGKQNNCDIAEQALMINVKNKDMNAIKYVLSHNSETYRPKDRKVTIVHDSGGQKSDSEKTEHSKDYYNGYTDALKTITETISDEYQKDSDSS